MSAKKKFINSPEDAVDDSLRGLCRAHPGLKLLAGHRVLVRADFEAVKSQGYVRLVCGGGSGHEPAFGGMVGPGMLTAAVAGQVFASPPVCDVLAALRLLGQKHPAGVLLVIINYTGDRLNFGIAAEKAKSEGINVSTFVVADDRALLSDDSASGRRGLCGAAFVIKIAGAMAEAGCSLVSIVEALKQITPGLGTIGLSLSSCAIPGRQPTFQLPSEEMELGLGIHGEAGVERMMWAPAKMSVHILIDRLLRRRDGDNDPFSIQPGDRLAVIVNNLGGTSALEMNVVVAETYDALNARNVVVERLYTGAVMTALEMAGVSLTLLRVDDKTLGWIDAATEAPAWPRPFVGSYRKHSDDYILHRELPGFDSSDALEKGAILSVENGKFVEKVIIKICEDLVENESLLNDLDAESGDGDCGTTMARFARDVASRRDLPFRRPAALLTRLAGIAVESMGGTSGGVYGLGLMAAAKKVEDEPLLLKSWHNALKAAMSSAMHYGKAKVGDRTLLDALVPIEAAFNSNESLEVVIQRAAHDVTEAVEKTKGMKPKAGRAAHVRRSSLRRPDPGAFAVGIWMNAIAVCFSK